jgi:cellulose synthase/poly-beta-1,6-N-acetylglucosamine synthase-like glycosyltransferase
METFLISLEGYAGGARPGVPLSFSFWPEVPMTRERALKGVLVLVGLLFSAAVYPLLAMHLEEALRMMLSVYATLGIFLLLASRDPSANRSLIAFTAWSSFAHAAVMAVQLFYNLIPRSEAVGVLLLAIIGVTLLVLAPGKPSAELASATTAARV